MASGFPLFLHTVTNFFLASTLGLTSNKASGRAISASIMTSMNFIRNLSYIPPLAHLKHILLKILQSFHRRAEKVCTTLGNPHYPFFLVNCDLSTLPICFPQIVHSPLLARNPIMEEPNISLFTDMKHFDKKITLSSAPTKKLCITDKIYLCKQA